MLYENTRKTSLFYLFSHRQQDAQEFFLHLCNQIEKNHARDAVTPIHCLRFSVENRIQCGATGQVRVWDFIFIPSF